MWQKFKAWRYARKLQKMIKERRRKNLWFTEEMEEAMEAAFWRIEK